MSDKNTGKIDGGQKLLTARAVVYIYLNSNPVRLFLWLAIATVLVACSGSSPKEEQVSRDSTATSPYSPLSSAAESKDFVFFNNTFFDHPLALEIADTVAVRKRFRDNLYTSNLYYHENNSLWYSHHTMTGSVGMEYYYFPGESKNIYIDYINTNDKRMFFANGIQVGMSKADFVSLFKLDTAKIGMSNMIVMNTDSALHEATFEFGDDTLLKVTVSYEYDDSYPLPQTLNNLADQWTAIVINEGEGQTEMFTACDFLQYRFGTDSGPRMSKINTLEMRWENESRTDSVTNIVRTEDGLFIYTRDASSDWAPAMLHLVFLDDRWSTATWNERPFAISAVADILTEEPCGDDE